MLILGFVIGAVVIATFFFLGGQLIQQRRQVIEMRQTNVTLFQENQNLKAAYANLHEQVKKFQAGPVSAALSYEQIEKIAGLVAAKVDALLEKPKLVN